MTSFFSGSGIKSFVSNVGIDLKPKFVGETVDSGNQKLTFAGINAPFIGKVGLTIDSTGGYSVGRFKDPRAALRAIASNKVVVPPGFGAKASKAVPASRGGVGISVDMKYDELKSKLLSSGTLFEDTDFPAVDSSLFYSQASPRPMEWKRPSEICGNPQFVTGGASRFDVRQGELGDCWLLAAIACLSMNDDLLDQVVPQDQNFTNGYCGLFRFHFWRFGEWKEVVVDDRLPTYNGQLVFMHSVAKNEFWSALLEKAYAKLCGSYESLRGGTTSEALEDFTGGISELFDLKGKEPPDMLAIMLKAYQRHSLLACSIQADPNVLEAHLPNGLIMGHAYSVTSVKSLNLNTHGSQKPVTLVRIRNPWGNEAEWTGSWSDRSSEWSMLTTEQRNEIGLTVEADGEFWMSYDDFVRNYEKLEICFLGPQSMSDTSGGSHCRTAFEMSIQQSCWQSRVSAGGCRNFLETFWSNPQFRVNVVDPDEDDAEDKGTLIIGLMQKDRRKMRKEGADLLTIGYIIYKLENEKQGPLDVNFFKYNAATARSPAFINLREICGRHRLAPGSYVIVPSTFKPNEEADFMLRIFSEKAYTSETIDEETGVGEPSADDQSTIPQAINDSQVEALRRAFTKVAGSDDEIDADELRDILNVAFTKVSDGEAPLKISASRPIEKARSLLCCTGNPKQDDDDFNFAGFSLEACRSMIAMMDVDRSGSLDFDEFKTLWEQLRLWKAAFKKYDTDKSGTMNSLELRGALHSVGYRVSNDVFSSLVLRFSKRDGTIYFDDYIICCSRLRTAFETIKAQLGCTKGHIEFDENTFINTIVYL